MILKQLVESPIKCLLTVIDRLRLKMLFEDIDCFLSTCEPSELARIKRKLEQRLERLEMEQE